MLNRHRVPTVFSIYMLDVICCALGCVILLWQVKHNEAEEQTAAALSASSEVRSVNAEIDTLRAALAASRQQYQDALSAKAHVETALAESRQRHQQALGDKRRIEKDRDEANQVLVLSKQKYEALREAWRLSDAMLKNVRGDLTKLKETNKLAAADLAAKIKTNAELLLQVSAAEKKIAALEKHTAVQKLDAAEAAHRLADQLARLKKLEAQNLALARHATDLRTAEKDALAKLTVQQVRAKVLADNLERTRKELAANTKGAGSAQAAIAALEKERTALVERVTAVQREADRRFAGIALTGENVLFLVDMSGSMAMIDEKTADPEKWPLVCETVVQLMRSIKGLRFFQVLLFSDRVRYPLGSPATWLKYDPKETPKKTLAALKAVQPDGETNMHAVFAEAFRYREAASTRSTCCPTVCPTPATTCRRT